MSTKPSRATADARQGSYQPSPSERVREQVASYEATDGREGGTVAGRPVVILTTLGARTGSVRKNPVLRIEQDGSYVAVASAAGARTHPAWYRNLLAHPDSQLRDGAVVHEVRAREVFGEEKAYWWRVAEANWPHFPEYRAKAAGRDIPVMLLEPREPREPRQPTGPRQPTEPTNQGTTTVPTLSKSKDGPAGRESAGRIA